MLGRIIRRFFLLLLAAVILVGGLAGLMVKEVLTGPSEAARDRLCLALTENEKTAWIPGLFLDPAVVLDITGREEESLPPLPQMQEAELPVNTEIPESDDDEWADYPDGIRIEQIEGLSFKAYAMMIRDPSRVYLGLSSNDGFSSTKPGKRINEAKESENAAAAINSGAFFDDGTSNIAVGATPQGLVFSGGNCVWTYGTPPMKGFAGFDQDNRLVVTRENIKKDQAEELGIRDGCCFGPALIINGERNEEAYDPDSGWNPRTAIGQRKDGTVIFLCIDGRQAASVGGTFADVIDVMESLGAYNACNMDGGSSTVMMYRDTLGKYGEAGQVHMVNSYSQLQLYPRRMPDYWMVRPLEKE